MPLRARARVAAALAALGAGLAAAAALAASGRPVAGTALAATLVALALLVADALWERFDLAGSTLVHGRRDRPEVALTFDDGPGPDTPAVLDALDRAGVKATFFVLGRAAETRPEWVRETARRGHLVALHGHTHRQLHLAGPRTAASEIDRCAAAVRAAGVEPAPLFRAPHGRKGLALRRALRARKLALVGWSRGVWDSERPGADAIVARACARPRGGEILLLHDGSGEAPAGEVPPDRRRDQTAAAVPEIVRRWEAEGYRFVTLAELAPPPPRRRATLLHGLAIAALAGGAIAALRSVDLAAVGEALLAAQPAPLLLAMGANVAALGAQSLRWHLLVSPAAPGARLAASARALVGGFAIGLIAPARASDVARVHLHARESGAPVAALAASVALDHVCGAATLVAALVAAGLATPLPPWVRAGAFVTALAAGGAALVLALAARPRPERAPGPEGRIAAAVSVARAALAVGPRPLALSFAAGLAGWACEAAIAAACLAAVGLPVTARGAVFAVLATTFASAAAVLPANAGGFELSAALAVGAVGATPETAAAFAVAYRVVHALPVALLGAPSLRRRHGAGPGEEQARVEAADERRARA